MEYQKIEFELLDLCVFLFELMLKTPHFALQFRRIADRCAGCVLLLFSLHNTLNPKRNRYRTELMIEAIRGLQ